MGILPPSQAPPCWLPGVAEEEALRPGVGLLAADAFRIFAGVPEGLRVEDALEALVAGGDANGLLLLALS